MSTLADIPGPIGCGRSSDRDNGAPRFAEVSPSPVQRPAIVRIDREKLPYSALLGDPVYRRTRLLALRHVVCRLHHALFNRRRLHDDLGVAALSTSRSRVDCGGRHVRLRPLRRRRLCYGERMERKAWLPVSAVLTVVGQVIVALAGNQIGLSVVGSVILFFGFNLWVPIAYSWTTENFPNRARTTGFALVDGVGHLGGGIGLLLIAPLIPHLNALDAMLLACGFLVIAAVIAQFGTATRSRDAGRSIAVAIVFRCEEIAAIPFSPRAGEPRTT